MKDKEGDLLSEKRIEVITKSVPEEVQTEVVDICMAADDLADAKKYSRVIKKSLDQKFGKGWNVIIGTNFTGNCSVAENSLLQMKIGSTFVLVFRSTMIVRKEVSKT